MIYTAIILAVVFLVFVFGSFYINELQKRNVDQAVALAQEQAHIASTEVAEMISKAGDSDLSSPEMRERLKPKTEVIMKLNEKAVWVGIFDASGNQIIERTHDDEKSIALLEPGGEPINSKLPVAGKDKVEVTVSSKVPKLLEVKEPIVREGQKQGEVRIKISENATFQRIEKASRNITLALALECAALLLFLVAVFWALWRLFARQLALTQKNAQLDRMAYVGTLASGLAHEIRNPLGAMSVNLQVMEEELADPSNAIPGRAKELASRVQREVLQLNSTLTTFLDFALPTKENFTDFSISGLVKELLESHAEQFKQAGISMELDSPPDKETVIEADRRQIHQAFRNIILNAAQILSGSVKRLFKITITPKVGGMVAVNFSDSGPGIPPENLSKIFEVFFSTRKGGSGFGLAVARKIIEEHGGRVWAENNVDSLGATFFVELPREGPARLK
ncbi:MAG: hypothetical protein K1X53_13880 [Candidatus Sumerlaeaceae bacterium]|nr:hypothetical protein [Candidatus Sumerlaeaceae bacterium]